MLGPKGWHLLDVAMCVVGVVSGLSGGVGFSVVYTNDAAALWAAVSGLLAVVCLVLELCQYHRLLHTVCTAPSLLLTLSVACIVFTAAIILSALHIGIGVSNQEPFPSKGNIGHSDYIIAIWTFVTTKWAFKLMYASTVARKQFLTHYVTQSRASSPDLLARQEEEGAGGAGSAASGDRRPLLIDAGLAAVSEPDYEESAADMEEQATRVFGAGRRQTRDGGDNSARLS